MINHIRTLLLNRGRDGAAPTVPGEEYVPVEARQLQLPQPLALFHSTIFGQVPDRTYLNYRLWQLMNLLHATELQQYVYAKDTRVTYWPSTRTDLFDSAFVSSWSQIAGSEPRQLYLSGTATANESTGQCEQAFRLEITGTEECFEYVQVERLVPPLTINQRYSDSVSGLSKLVKLDGTSMSFRFQVGEIETAWIVKICSRPPTDIITLLDRFIESANAATVAGLFPNTANEPAATFRSVWYDHPVAAYRYAALLLAICEQLDRLRLEQVHG